MTQKRQIEIYKMYMKELTNIGIKMIPVDEFDSPNEVLSYAAMFLNEQISKSNKAITYKNKKTTKKKKVN